MPKKTNEFTGKAFITTFFSILGFVIAILAWRKDKYVMYYAKQSLLVFIAAILSSVISGLVAWIPIIGWIIIIILNVFVAVIWFQSWIYALSGKEREVYFIGEFSKKFEL